MHSPASKGSEVDTDDSLRNPAEPDLRVGREVRRFNPRQTDLGASRTTPEDPHLDFRAGQKVDLGSDPRSAGCGFAHSDFVQSDEIGMTSRDAGSRMTYSPSTTSVLPVARDTITIQCSPGPETPFRSPMMLKYQSVFECSIGQTEYFGSVCTCSKNVSGNRPESGLLAEGMQVGAQGIGSEVLFPKPRAELGHA
jgi:hypothetical protein